MSGMRKNQGINLVELILVLVITAVLVTIAIPSFVNYLQQNQLIGTTDNLYYALQYARSEAIKRNTTIYVNLQTGTTWCYGINPGATCNCATAGNCTLGSTQNLSTESITFSTTGVTNNTLTFEPTHGAAYVNGFLTFTLTGLTTAMSVNVGIQGDLQVCSNQVSGYSACT